MTLKTKYIENHIEACTASDTTVAESLEEETVPVSPVLHAAEAPEVRARERGVQHRASGDRAPQHQQRRQQRKHEQCHGKGNFISLQISLPFSHDNNTIFDKHLFNFILAAVSTAYTASQCKSYKAVPKSQSLKFEFIATTRQSNQISG